MTQSDVPEPVEKDGGSESEVDSDISGMGAVVVQSYATFKGIWDSRIALKWVLEGLEGKCRR